MDAGSVRERHHDVTAFGVRMRVTEWSSGDAHEGVRPVVALPGLLTPRTALRGLGAELSRSFRVIAVDLPGFGDSEKPPPSKYPYTIATFAEGLADLFGALSLSRAHLLGHGVGGTVALHFAAQHPELVDRLCLIAPMGDLSGSPLRRALLLPVLGGTVFRQLAGRSSFRRLYGTWINPGASPEELDEYYEALAPPAARAALLATLRHAQGAQTSIADSRRLRAQCLLVWGAHDRVFPVEEGRALSREMPQCGLEVLPYGHAPHEEAPAHVASIVERFFAGRRAGFG